MHPEATLRRTIWAQLTQAVTDRKHAWRTPVLANVDEQGQPQARTVVLRAVLEQHQRLLFYTDYRSPKAVALAADPAAVLVFWSEALRWQLRVSVDVSIETAGATVEEAWESMRHTAAAADYLSSQAPGSPVFAAAGERAAQSAFGVVVANVHSIDWLELDRAGHRRARLTADAVEWLVP